MQILKYYSTWNFCGWLLTEINVIPVNNICDCSIFITSIIGGFICHIYPAKIAYMKNKKKYYLSYKYVLAIDMLVHQIPMYRLLTRIYRNNNISNNISNTSNKIQICGGFLLIPTSLYMYYLNYNNLSIKKIYKINDLYIVVSGISILSLIGLKKHKFFNICNFNY